jgi:cytoskeleton protein RodZ
MASVGDHLRDLRQRRGLSVDEISRTTRVASRYLEALESDRFAALPAPVFTRGFILAYCQALGEPPEEALALYDGRDGVPAPAPRPASAPAARLPASDGEPRSRSAVLVSFVLLVILGMALFAVALMTQPAREDRVDRGVPAVAEAPIPAPTPPPSTASTESLPPAATAATPQATRPPTVAAAPLAPPATPASTAATPTPTQAAGGPAAATEPVRPPLPPPWLPEVQAATGGVASPYRLVARVSEPTWIRVRTEDGHSSEETVPAGQTREWVSNRPFVLTLGNAGGVTLELNGRTLPPLGASGAVISRIVLPPQ